MINRIRAALQRVLEYLAHEIAKALHALNEAQARALAEAEEVIDNVVVEINRDGVCIGDGVIAAEGERVVLTREVADLIVGNGHGRVL